MSRIRKLFAATRLVALAVAIAALAGIAYAQVYVHPQTQIAFPAEIAGLQNRGPTDYEAKQAGLGVSVRYQTIPELWADVYVYTAGLAQIPSDIDHPLMAKLRLQTEREIEAYAKGNGYEAQKTEGGTAKIRTAKGVVPVYYDAFLFSGSGGQYHSWVWLWPARNHFFKIRMTRVGGEPDRRAVREFLETVVGLSAE